jgi:hypothetical protein
MGMGAPPSPPLKSKHHAFWEVILHSSQKITKRLIKGAKIGTFQDRA